MLTEEQQTAYLQVADEIKELVESYKRVDKLSPILVKALIKDTKFWMEELERLQNAQIKYAVDNNALDVDSTIR